ncbi:MAG TPA: DUF6518 family protein [Gaiellaceae bacterium]|nr:DUF6518 family protein [Gaiellaceae bacterium]
MGAGHASLGRIAVVGAAVALSFVFGGADQFLGSLSAHPWATEVSLLSAPWLLLAFLAGCTQREPKRATLLGLACTLSALVGYGLMTLSPVENAQLTLQSATAFVRSQSDVIAGGVVTGPLFGWLGNRWRNDRVWLGALVIAAAFCLEPLALIPAGREIDFRAVWIAEVAVGLAMVLYVTTEARARRRRMRTATRPADA